MHARLGENRQSRKTDFSAATDRKARAMILDMWVTAMADYCDVIVVTPWQRYRTPRVTVENAMENGMGTAIIRRTLKSHLQREFCKTLWINHGKTMICCRWPLPRRYFAFSVLTFIFRQSYRVLVRISVGTRNDIFAGLKTKHYHCRVCRNDIADQDKRSVAKLFKIWAR